jgi:small subunit ribosomal protein S20
MPNTRSAEKRMRQTAVSADRNKSKKSRITSEKRNLTDALMLGDVTKAEAAYKKLASALDKGVKAGVIKANKANRGKSRASKMLTKAGK